jgi:hypothetical protein
MSCKVNGLLGFRLDFHLCDECLKKAYFVFLQLSVFSSTSSRHECTQERTYYTGSTVSSSLGAPGTYGNGN